MATSGTNYTGKWTLSNGVLTLEPKSGSSGQFRSEYSLDSGVQKFVTLTEEERKSVTKIVFSETVSFYKKGLMQSTYSKVTDYSNFLKGFISYSYIAFPNLSDVDVTGLDTAGGTKFRSMFAWLTSITGLDKLNVNSGKDFAYMFQSSKLATLDVSHFPLNTAESISYMFYGMNYCSTITLPSNFSRTNTGEESSLLGLAPATNANGITVRNDGDFFKLPSGQQGGTWTRDISGTAKLKFSVSNTVREADKATLTYSYATSTATVSLYLKKSSESSFPSEPAETFTLTGTGTGSIEVTLPTDDSYDVWIVVTDGNETIYTYPSIDSNILLFKIKKDKTVEDGEGYSIPHYSEAVITSYNSGWTVYDSTDISAITVRKYGRFVTLTGVMKNTAKKTINTDEQTMFTIPEGYRPMQVSKAMCQGTDTATWMLTVNTNGTVTAARYRLHANSYPSVATGSWFPFHITYISAD